MSVNLDGLFSDAEGADAGTAKMFDILRNPQVSQIICHRHDKITFIEDGSARRAERVFSGPAQYEAFLDVLLAMTDAGFESVNNSNASFLEGSFLPELINIHGAIHIATSEVTRGEPVLTVRKQPFSIVTLDEMLRQGMLNSDMRLFLEAAVRGRSNIMVSGGSGAGKTTLARALSWFIDPAQVVVTCEEIDELHLYDRLQNVSSLTTIRKRDHEGRIVRETTLDDLVRESLRMRADRVWVGETRGKEAYALIKACNSGHDGSVTTLHADDGKQAIRQMRTYVMESGLPELPATQQVATAMNLVVQINRLKMGKRFITEITYIEPVVEGSGDNQRLTPLWRYNPITGTHEMQVPAIPGRLLDQWARYGVNWETSPQRS